MISERATYEFLLRYEQLVKRLQGQLERLGTASAGDVRGILNDLLAMSGRTQVETRALVRRMARQVAEAEGGILPQETVDRLANQAARLLGQVVKQVEKAAIEIGYRFYTESVASASAGVTDVALTTTKPIMSVQVEGEIKKAVEQVLDQEKAKGKLFARLMEVFKDQKTVTVNGRTFDRRTYAKMVAHNTNREIEKASRLWEAERNGSDLVAVSPNKSKINDWCNAYRGKVFSVSGKTAGVVPLSRLPNGGPPFHIFCWHRLEVLYDEPTPSELEVEERWLLSGPGDSVRRIAKAWAAENEVLPRAQHPRMRH